MDLLAAQGTLESSPTTVQRHQFFILLASHAQFPGVAGRGRPSPPRVSVPMQLRAAPGLVSRWASREVLGPMVPHNHSPGQLPPEASAAPTEAVAGGCPCRAGLHARGPSDSLEGPSPCLPSAPCPPLTSRLPARAMPRACCWCACLAFPLDERRVGFLALQPLLPSGAVVIQ